MTTTTDNPTDNPTNDPTADGGNAGELNLDWLISVDDHILEPGHLWIDRVAAKDRDRAPHIQLDENGMDFWTYDGKKFPSSGLSAVAGKSKEEFSPEPLPYSEMRPGCYDPKARLEDMDRAGILASLCFPTITRFCGQMFMEASDREFGFECLRHYNDWIVEEWCGSAPGRYIPLMLIPMWDPSLAAKEMERMAAKGVTAFAFSENPAPLGLPTIHDPNRYWDPVMSTANELQMVASMHVGSSSTVPQISPDSPFMANLAWGAIRTSGAMLAWLFSGMFQRFPNLKIALSEGEIGWMPYFLERAEQVLDKQRYWVGRGQQWNEHAGNTLDLDNFDVRETFRNHVYGCFIEDHHGIDSIEEIGEDNIMCETDYPHSDSTWPDCIGTARRVIKDLTPAQQYKVLRGNAERLYRFTPAEPPAKAGA
jgi:predicted TIM-barrel fold metal-dependent hydrolase